VLKAPFKGLKVHESAHNSPSTACEGTNIFFGSINTTTGSGGFYRTNNVTSCGNLSGGTTGQSVWMSILLSHQVFFHSTGAGKVVVTLQATSNVFVTSIPGTCTPRSSSLSNCTEVTVARENATAYLRSGNLHNVGQPIKRWPGTSAYLQNYTDCRGGVCNSKVIQSSLLNSSSNVTWSWTFTGNFTSWPMAIYDLEIFFYSTTEAEYYVSHAVLSGMSALASLNSATNGNHLELISMKVVSA
jgi:hypothetical protein